jgi:hypothetical protein
MSATLPNLDVLAKWLEAELVTTDYRPVPLVERIMIGDNFYDKSLLPIRPVLGDVVPMTIAVSTHTIEVRISSSVKFGKTKTR